MSSIPITVFTGFLGAGKTTTILSLLKRLPKDYKVVLLKNEFGDVEVDSKLAQQSSLTAVSEILNGCMCCVLVGQMQNALIEIRGTLKKTTLTIIIASRRLRAVIEKYHPDRIIIECSGSAFPATLAFQIRQLERDTDGHFNLDSIITVIDAENFVGYEDTSPTAKMQASYTDIILINKWEHVSERALDIVIDHLYTLNDETLKIKCQGKEGVDPNLIFGVQSKLFLSGQDSDFGAIHDEVETLTIYRGVELGDPKESHSHSHERLHHHSDQLVALPIDKSRLAATLDTLPKDSVWRAKGFVRLVDGTWVSVNWAFGRCDIQEYAGGGISGEIRLTLMGCRGSVRRPATKFASLLGSFVGHENH